ncbi:MAG: lysostaphin resistance A-like protein [Candidatus Thorarchaeota archaeon]
MTKGSEEHNPNGTLSEWDQTIIIFFIVILLGVAVYYWFFWGDLWVPLLSLIGSFTLYYISMDDSESMYKPIKRSWNPLIEAAIVLMIVLTWIIIINPLLNYDLGFNILGSLIFEFVFPYLLLVTYFGYKRQSIGLDFRKSTTDKLVIVVCTVLIISRVLGLMLSPNGISNLMENIIYLIYGIIFLGFIVGFVEEFIFRGIIQNRIAFHFRSRVLGIVLTSSLFAAIHVISVMTGLAPTPLNVGSALVYAFMTRLPLGIILGLVWNDSENLIGVSLIHASNNIAFLIQSLI